LLGHWARDQFAEVIGYDFLPDEGQRSHPATKGMTISHERTSIFKFWGSVIKWGGRLVGALAGAWVTALEGAAVGGVVGTVVPGVGNVAGAVIGGVAGALFGAWVGYTAADVVTQPLESAIESAGDNLSVVSGKIIEGSPNVWVTRYIVINIR